MIYLCLAVIFLHLISAPIVIGTAVYFDSDKKIAELSVRLFFIPVFVKRLDYESLTDKIVAKSKENEKEKETEKEKSESAKGVKLGAGKRYFIRLGLNVLKRIRIRRVDIESEIGAGDAAVSAVTAGFMKTVYSDVRALFLCDGRENIRLNYDEECIFIDFDGIISVCIGDIIYAAICAVKLPRRAVAPNLSGAKV